MKFKRETMSSSIINLDVRFKIRSAQLSAFGLTEEDISAKTFRTHPTKKKIKINLTFWTIIAVD
jgi:hypothetical protein